MNANTSLAGHVPLPSPAVPMRTHNVNSPNVLGGNRAGGLGDGVGHANVRRGAAGRGGNEPLDGRDGREGGEGRERGLLPVGRHDLVPVGRRVVGLGLLQLQAMPMGCSGVVRTKK